MSWDKWHHDPREGEEPDWHERLEELDAIRGIQQSAHRCRHGIDLERAGCGACLEAGATCDHGRTVAEYCWDCDQATGEAMARAMVKAMDKILGGAK